MNNPRHIQFIDAQRLWFIPFYLRCIGKVTIFYYRKIRATQYTLRINTFSIDNLKSELIYVKNQHSNKLREADTLKNNLEKYSEAIKEAEILEKQIALLENRIQKEEKYNTNLWTGQDTDRRADKKAA